MARRSRIITLAATLGLTLLAVGLGPGTVSGFTQSGAMIDALGGAMPMGHEWITRLAALEVLCADAPCDPVVKATDPDPRDGWTKGTAKRGGLDGPGQQEADRIKGKGTSGDKRYQSVYKVVLDAIVGERWVDIGGFNVTNAQVTDYDCFDLAVQQPPHIQYDHFMRRYDDRGGEGGVRAATKSRQRFIEHFVSAAMAPRTSMMVWDGGGSSALTEVDRNYFLFGRAVHLFQDSFSEEHTVRLPGDNYESVREVKSYLCAAGSEQHRKPSVPKVATDYSSTGDVIWNSGTEGTRGWKSYKLSNMKPRALVATEATKDLWAAFIRTMGVPLERRAPVAQTEATRVADDWLRLADGAQTWYDDAKNRDATYLLDQAAVTECVKGLKKGTEDQQSEVDRLKEGQRICLYNIAPMPGYSDLWDPLLHMPFHWQWKGMTWDKKVPDTWKPGDRAADSGIRVRIKNAGNGQYLAAPDGIANDKRIYARAGATPLEFILVGDKDGGFFRLADDARLFLSYRAMSGAAKLYSSPEEAAYKLEKAAAGWAIFNLYWKDYMWLKGESPYIDRKGDPGQANAQWVIEGLPADW